MKRFLILAAVVGGLAFGGMASTAKADHFHGGYGWGGYRRFGGYGYGYRPYPGYVVAPNVGTSVYFGTPQFGFGLGNAFGNPYYGGYGYRGHRCGYGW